MFSPDVALDELDQFQMALIVNGGYTESSFPLTEACLVASTRMIELLIQCDFIKEMFNFTSTIDYLLCEIYPEQKEECFAYYCGQGQQLKDSLAPDEIEIIDNQMVKWLIDFSIARARAGGVIGH